MPILYGALEDAKKRVADLHHPDDGCEMLKNVVTDGLKHKAFNRRKWPPCHRYCYSSRLFLITEIIESNGIGLRGMVLVWGEGWFEQSVSSLCFWELSHGAKCFADGLPSPVGPKVSGLPRATSHSQRTCFIPDI